jgi:HK97 family phage major capsid protein
MTVAYPMSGFTAADAARLTELGNEVQTRDLSGREIEEFEALEQRMIRARGAEVGRPVTDALVVGSGRRDDAGLDAAFTAYLRTGQPNSDISQLRNAQSEGVGSAGGFLVPEGFRTKLVDRLKAYGGVASLAEEVVTESGNTLPWPTIDDTANEGEVVDEHGTWTAGADLVFDTASLGAHRYSAGGGSSTPIRVSVELLQDAAVDVEGIVARKLAQRIGRIQARHLVSGTGVKQPKGIVHNLTGVQTAASTGGLTYADLLEFIHSVDPAYREEPGRCNWMFNDNTLQAIRGMEDAAGDPLWRPSTADMGTLVGSGSLLGFPIKVDQAFPDFVNDDPAVNFGAFGDVREGYVVRRVRDIVVVVNPWTRASYGEVEFSAWARMDAVPQNTNAYSALTGKA